MTLPRHYLSQGVYAVSRRCHGRKFLLKPTSEVSELLPYLLAHCLRGKKVSLLAFAPQTNHYHLVLVDLSEPHEPSDLDRFFCHFNSLLARALNAHFGRVDHLWCSGSYHPVEVGTKEALESQLLYAWSNCVKDGMVRHPERWPGYLTLPKDLGTSRTVKKPSWAFFGGRGLDQRPPSDERARRRWEREREREEKDERRWARARFQKQFPQATDAVLDVLADDYMVEWRAEHRPIRRHRPRSRLPETVTLEIGRPPGFESYDLEALQAYFHERLEERVRQIQAARKQRGFTTTVGKRRLLSLDPHSAPKGAKKASPTRKPRFSCGSDRARHMELLARWQSFQSDYEQALEVYDAKGDPVFPLGTVLMLRRHQVRVRLPQAPP